MAEASETQALFDAIKAGDLERVKSLVSADAALVTARGDSGDSAVLTAVYHRQREIANLLVARGATLSLFEACAAGEFDAAERLVAASPDAVGAYSDDGWTPLHLAAFFGHPRIAELLLAHDADVAARRKTPTPTCRCTRRWPRTRRWWRGCSSAPART